jgi:hypothetical protein
MLDCREPHSSDYTNIQGLEYCCQHHSDQRWDTWINGPRGLYLALDIGESPCEYYEQYPDRLWDLYQLLSLVADGFYHCCLSGRCSLYLDNAR